MKKLLMSFFALTLSFGGFAQQFNLGKVSFATDSVWTISGNGITQIWSDAVQTDSCSHKTSFDGGTWQTLIFNIDCRSNPDYKGDLFSWRAVNELKDKFCPHPWRVPTRQDFVNLDIVLGGNGQNRFQQLVNADSGQTPLDNYINRWDGAYGGNIGVGGSLIAQGLWANYWSQTEDDATSVRILIFSANGYINPQGAFFKNNGFSLRCVRDN
ncbi:MAG: hypothetical protein LBH22_02500 [Bacteroidales bacterium]|jgi:uncharacterized protein (TIGR02145 family)|nr:hypothetical protein [Bacteroidales bacterium]